MTENQYLENVARCHRDTTISIGESGAEPATLVDRACREMDANGRAHRRRDPLCDQIWCVFDVDEHPNIAQAIGRAQQKGVAIAVSNPCFELWLVLHRQERTAYINSRDVQRVAGSLGLIEGKELTADAIDQIFAAFESAKSRARQLDRMHHLNGSPPRSNPSTGVWRLVDAIKSGARVRA